MARWNKGYDKTNVCTRVSLFSRTWLGSSLAFGAVCISSCKFVLTFLRWCFNNRSRSIHLCWISSVKQRFKNIIFALCFCAIHTFFKEKTDRDTDHLSTTLESSICILSISINLSLSFLVTAAILVYPYLFFSSNLLHFPPALCFNWLSLVSLVLSHLVFFTTCLCFNLTAFLRYCQR